MLLALAGLGGLAWRLAERPLVVPQLARALERAINDRPQDARLSIGRAAITWAGFRSGIAAPLDIRLSNVQLSLGATGSRLDLPNAAVTLSLGALLRGTIAPATLRLRDARLHAVLLPDGSIALGTLADPVPGAPEAATIDPLVLLAGLMHPAHERDSFGALQRISIEGGEAVLEDPAQGRRWALVEPEIELKRDAEGGLSAEGRGKLRSGAVTLPVRLDGSARGTPMQARLVMSLPPVQPRDLAAFWPGLAPLDVLDSPITLNATAEFDAALKPTRLTAQLEGGPGSVALGTGANPPRLRIAGLSASLEGAGRRLHVREARLRLPGADGKPGPDLTGRIEVERAPGGGFQGVLTAGIDRFAFAELPRLWPAEFAVPARAKVLAALAGGTLQDLGLKLGFRVPESLDRVTLGESRLDVSGADLVVVAGRGARVKLASAKLAASFDQDHMRIEQAMVRFPPSSVPNTPPPTIEAQASAERRDRRWQIKASAKLDQANAIDIPGYWPDGLTNGKEREWLVENITAGITRNGRWQVTATAPESLDDLDVTTLTGTAEFDGGTVHWLRPIPPIAGLAGTVEFGLREITVRGRGGRQIGADGKPTALEVKEATGRFFNFHIRPGNAEIRGSMTGPLTDAVTLLRHPRLKLFEKRPLELNPAAGKIDGALYIGFPLWFDLNVEQLTIRASGKVIDGKLLGALLERDLDRVQAELAVTTETLKGSGQASFLGVPVKLTSEMDFRNGPATQIIDRASLTGRFGPEQLATFGLDAGKALSGTVALEARAEKRRNGAGTVTTKADLREAQLAPEGIGWSKPAGTPGRAEAVLRLQGSTVTTLESFRVEAPDLLLRGAGSFGAKARLERLDLTEASFAGSRFSGQVNAPGEPETPWAVRLQGPLLDLRPIFGDDAPKRAEQPETRRPPLALDLRFDQVLLGEGRALYGLAGTARLDALGTLGAADLTGRTAAAAGQGGFELQLTPQGERRALHIAAADAGGVLAAFGVTKTIEGGRLTVNAAYADAGRATPLMGTAELDGFLLHDAPAVGKLLQVLSVYGIPEALQGGRGLQFNRLVAPFSLSKELLALDDARAFSASLGLTAKGKVWREQGMLELEGTLVPSYMLNSLLGHIPVIGKLFSPEAGGGLIAMSYSMRGPKADPQVRVNPLSALTPGALRGLFQLGTPAR